MPKTQGLINNKNLLLTVLEARSPRSVCQHGRVLVRALFWVADCWGILMSSNVRKSELALWPLKSTLIPFMSTSPSGPNYLLKAPPPNIITLGIDCSIWIWSGLGPQIVQSITNCNYMAICVNHEIFFSVNTNFVKLYEWFWLELHNIIFISFMWMQLRIVFGKWFFL